MRQLYQASRVARGFTSGFLSRTSSSAASTVNVQDARPFEEIPRTRGRYNIPGIGVLFHFKPFTDIGFKEPARMFDRIMDEHGQLVYARLGRWMLLVEDPDDIEQVFRNEGQYPSRPSGEINKMYWEQKNVPAGIGLLNGEEWHKARSPLNPLMMRTQSAQYYLPVQNEVADDLVDHLKNHVSAAELGDLCYRYACESISVMCFNKRLGYLDLKSENKTQQDQTLKDISSILLIIVQSFNFSRFALNTYAKKMKRVYFECADRINSQTTQYYEDAVNLIEQQKREGTLDVDKHNFMLSLMTSGRVSPEMMSSIAFSLFVAGTDSTARTSQVVLYHLAKNPDKQEKLYREIHSLIGDSRPLTKEALISMTYLPACLRESFRLSYPTVTGTQRVLPHDTVIGGYNVPAKTLVIMMNQRAAKNPKYFPDPESFTPERWLRDEDGKRPNEVHPAALRPFGFGKRMCIGKRFAEQEIYLAVSKILQRYKVTLPAEETLQIAHTPFAGPLKPLNFSFQKRS